MIKVEALDLSLSNGVLVPLICIASIYPAQLVASIIAKKKKLRFFFGLLINIEPVPGSLSVQVGLVPNPNNFIVILYFESRYN